MATLLRNEYLISSIQEMVTLAPLAKSLEHSPSEPWQVTEDRIGRLRNAWLHIADGRIVASGEGAIPTDLQHLVQRPLSGKLLLPGFVDGHTHPCFAGDRSDEFAMRLAGATYQDIAAAGGGIQKTVRLTRRATFEQLVAQTRQHFDLFLRHGVTTVEAKSGYGLSVEDELRLLRAIQEAAGSSRLHVEATCLALHSVAQGTAKDVYIRQCIDELLPQVAEQRLAGWVDAFVEQGYFSQADVLPYFDKARSLGLGARLHADQFTNQHGGTLAAQIHAASVDHLECLDQSSQEALVHHQIVAMLLPGTSLYCAIPYADARSLTQRGVLVGLATDFNPGSCRFHNISFIATIGALHCGLSPWQALAAITLVPARSLRLNRRKGHLGPGADADFVVFDYQNLEQWIADGGQRQPHQVYVAGEPCL